jgi:hypothetical protein
MGKGLLFILATVLLLGLSGCVTVKPFVGSEVAGFADWTQSNLMDKWLDSGQPALIAQWGAPDETSRDGNGGQILTYTKKKTTPAGTVTTDILTEMFYVNADGKVYSWQWQEGDLRDNLKDFTALVKSLAYSNHFARTADGGIILWDNTSSYPNNRPADFDPGYAGILGTWYLKGSHSLRQNYAEAFNLFTLSANTGYPDAQENLGRLYETGLSGKKDLDSALYWYQQAASNGNQDAINNVKRLGVSSASHDHYGY